MGTFFGIDFGTTNTAVVALELYGDKPKFAHLAGEDGKPFPSIVAIPKDGQEWFYGQYAQKNRFTELASSHDIFRSMKSDLGTERKIPVKEKRVPVKNIVTEFLKLLKRDIKSKHKHDILEAAFAFPVDFPPEARRDLQEAAKAAGIKATAFLSESTAAYIANREKVKPYSRVMVIDWGGGTLDISVLQLDENKVYESAVWGEKIGGDDIDLELARRIHAKVASESKVKTKPSFDKMTEVQQDNMRVSCEAMKINFSEDDSFHFFLRDYGKYGKKGFVEQTIDYPFFKNVVTPIVKTKVLTTIDTALQRAGIGKEGIDAVIVAGGSSAVRPFHNAIVNTFGEKKIIPPKYVQWSIAEGAALAGVLGGNFFLSDDLCVLLSDGTPYPIFKKKSAKIGDEAKEIFSLTEDSQKANFIFCDSQRKIYAIKSAQTKESLQTKGFVNERLILDARIGLDQIADITVSSTHMEKGYEKNVKLNKLKFYYDLSQLPDDVNRGEPEKETKNTQTKKSFSYDAREAGDVI